MTNVDGNGRSGYQVVESKVVLREMERLRDSLTDPSARRRFAAALKAIRRRLPSTPGSSANTFTHFRRFSGRFCRLVAPLTVHYGVHRERKLVFVKNYHLFS